MLRWAGSDPTMLAKYKWMTTMLIMVTSVFVKMFVLTCPTNISIIDLQVDSSDWRGGAEMTYSGPVIALTANW